MLFQKRGLSLRAVLQCTPVIPGSAKTPTQAALRILEKGSAGCLLPVTISVVTVAWFLACSWLWPFVRKLMDTPLLSLTLRTVFEGLFGAVALLISPVCLWFALKALCLHFLWVLRSK
jgi:hypothetical protein